MYSTLSPSWEKHVLLALVSATFATAAPTTSSAQSFQGLGFLPGTSNSSAQGVNADGTVLDKIKPSAGRPPPASAFWQGTT
jgi:hypothetical protein